MAAQTGIGWTNATVNFWIGCTRCGPGCDGCYAAAWAFQKWNIVFEPGGERRPTKNAFIDPPRWQRAHEQGKGWMGSDDNRVPVPLWVFCNSLSDFFDKEADPELRNRAWAVIKACHHLRWQIVTKRVGLVERYLPDDWNGGVGYEHVGIVATMVNQDEIDRDISKLSALKDIGVRWVGLSIEPQLGPIRLGTWLRRLDWIITGGESKQDTIIRGEDGKPEKVRHPARPYFYGWALGLIKECEPDGVPIFVKQMGDNAYGWNEEPVPLKSSGTDPEQWPESLRVQQMPRIYDNEPARVLL